MQCPFEEEAEDGAEYDHEEAELVASAEGRAALANLIPQEWNPARLATGGGSGLSLAHLHGHGRYSCYARTLSVNDNDRPDITSSVYNGSQPIPQNQHTLSRFVHAGDMPPP